MKLHAKEKVGVPPLSGDLRRPAEARSILALLVAAALALPFASFDDYGLIGSAQARPVRAHVGGASGQVHGRVHHNVHVHHSVHVHRAVVVAPVRPIPGVRPWYWGRVVAGVTVGAIIVASTQPVAPSPDLCWFWADSSKTRGYWNYCVAPQR
jgi:hypothetical protein